MRGITIRPIQVGLGNSRRGTEGYNFPLKDTGAGRKAIREAGLGFFRDDGEASFVSGTVWQVHEL